MMYPPNMKSYLFYYSSQQNFNSIFLTKFFILIVNYIKVYYFFKLKNGGQ